MRIDVFGTKLLFDGLISDCALFIKLFLFSRTNVIKSDLRFLFLYQTAANEKTSSPFLAKFERFDFRLCFVY